MPKKTAKKKVTRFPRKFSVEITQEIFDRSWQMREEDGTREDGGPYFQILTECPLALAVRGKIGERWAVGMTMSASILSLKLKGKMKEYKHDGTPIVLAFDRKEKDAVKLPRVVTFTPEKGTTDAY